MNYNMTDLDVNHAYGINMMGLVDLIIDAENRGCYRNAIN